MGSYSGLFTLTQGDFFGEEAILPDNRRMLTAIGMKTCNMMSLEVEHLMMVTVSKWLMLFIHMPSGVEVCLLQLGGISQCATNY